VRPPNDQRLDHHAEAIEHPLYLTVSVSPSFLVHNLSFRTRFPFGYKAPCYGKASELDYLGERRWRGRMAIDLDGIYAAIGDDRAFGGLAARIAEACGTRSAILVELTSAGLPTLQQAHYWDEAFMTAYKAHFAHVDPWTETAIAVGRFGRATALDSAMSPGEFLRTAMYNDLFRTFGDDTGRCLGVMPILGREGLMMAIHRAAGDTAFTVREEKRLDEVYGHVHRVLSLRKMLRLEHGKSARLQDIVDQTGEAILRLSRNLRVVALSDAAQRLLERRDGLALHNQKLVLPTRIEAELRATVAAIIDRRPPKRIAFTCHRPSGRRPFRMVLLPAGFDGATGALLRIDDPDASPGPDWRPALRDAYGLSAMEADLAARLHANCSLDEIAVQRGVTRETLRTQLKSLFQKTGVARQTSLVKLLATFPAARNGGNSND